MIQVITRKEALNHKCTIPLLYMNNLPINSFICLENKYSHNILKFNCSSHIYHVQKYLKSIDLYPNASTYGFGACPISFAILRPKV